MDKSQVCVLHTITADRSNFNSRTKMPNAELPRLVEESWHMRQRYHCDGLYRVPIPTTHNGKTVFFTGIVDNARGNSVNYTYHQSPLDGQNYIIEPSASSEYAPARFAELIVAERFWVEREHSFMPERNYCVVSIRALPVKDVPTPPLEIAKIMASKHACHYDYNMEDVLASIAFWSHHCLVTK